MISAQAGLILKEKARIKEYSNAIRLVAMEEIQREFALRHVKMLQDAEIKYAQREKTECFQCAKVAADEKNAFKHSPVNRQRHGDITGSVCSTVFIWAMGIR
ncbi:hypothetical protein AK51_05860 [Serratia nematodiphila DZ0503SBS1]|nr:hypothetical protein AK51_05860 [Serratia nematodiphila DZ0503SBS1]